MPEKKFRVPVNGPYMITSPFGQRVRNGVSEFHPGIDWIGADKDGNGLAVPLRACADGIINYAHEAGSAGNCVVLVVPYNQETNIAIFYDHLEDFRCQRGQALKAGDEIGMMGNTGHYPDGKPSSDGVHGHVQFMIQPVSAKDWPWNEQGLPLGDAIDGTTMMDMRAVVNA